MSQQLIWQVDSLEVVAELGLSPREPESRTLYSILSKLPLFQPRGLSHPVRGSGQLLVRSVDTHLPWYSGVMPRANSRLRVQKVNLPLHCCSLFCTEIRGCD